MRTGPCCHCHAVLSTSSLIFPSPSWKNSFTRDMQKGIQLQEAWKVVKLVLFIFLLLEAMLSPPSLGRQSSSQGNRGDVT